MNLVPSLAIGLLVGLAWCQVRPPNYSPDLLPDTSFTCEDKVSGSYYADVEASCQLFHVCVQVSEYEFQDFHFLCPNDTVFDQQHLVCTNWFDVDCLQSIQFFPHDFAFDKGNPADYHDYTVNYDDRDYLYEDNDEKTSDRGTQTFLGFSQPASSGLQNAGRGQNQGAGSPVDDPDFDYYDQDEDVHGGRGPPRGTFQAGLGLTNPPIATTPIPLGFTTTHRPPNASPRVKSNIRQKQKHNRGGGSSHKSSNRVEDDKRKFSFASQDTPASNQVQEDATLAPSPFDHPPFISADGKKPRVKANINNQRIVSGNSQNKSKPKKQGSKKVELDRSQFSKIDFVKPTVQHQADPAIPPFTGPEVRPDGRVPRVKSNVRARERDQPFLSLAATSPRPRPHFRSQTTPAIPAFRGSPTPHPFRGSPVPQPFRGSPTPQPFRGSPTPQPFRGSPTPQSFRGSPTPHNTFGITPDSAFSSPRPRPFIPQPFIPQPTPAVPPDSFNARPPARPRPTNQFGLQSPIRQGTRDQTLPPRFPVRQEVRHRDPTLHTFPFDAPPSSFTASPQSPNKFTFLSTTAPQPSVTLSPLTFTQTSPQSSVTGKFNLRPSLQTRIPPSLPQGTGPPSFNHGTPSQPKIPPLLQRNRNRFGSRPRVKANELAQQSRGPQSGRTQTKFRESPRSFRQMSPKVKFKTSVDISNEIADGLGKCSNPFKCPPTKTAGGRRPRVKSNIKARKRNFWNPRKSRVIKRRKQAKLNSKLWATIRQGRKHAVTDHSSAIIDNSIDGDPAKGTTPDPISSLQRLVESKAGHEPEFFPPARSFQNKRLKAKQKINGRGRFRSRTTPAVTEAPQQVVSATSPMIPITRKTNNPRRINIPPKKISTNRQRPPEVEDLIRRFGPPQVETPRHAKHSDPFNLGPAPQPKIPARVQALLDKAPRRINKPEKFQRLRVQSAEVEALIKKFGPPQVEFRRPRPQTTEATLATTQVSVFVTNPDFQDTTTPAPPLPPLPLSLPGSAPTQSAPPNPFTASDMGLFVTNPRALPDHHKQHNPFSQPPERSRDGRRPRVKSNIMASLQNRPGPSQGLPVDSNTKEHTTEKILPVLRIKPDGRMPRVKSNQRHKHKQAKKNFRKNFRKQFQRKRTGRAKDVGSELENVISSDEFYDYVEPELRPDGKKPRIKSNLKTKKASKGKGQSFKKKNGRRGFRESKRVHHPSVMPFEATTKPTSPEELTDGTDNAITTFRPIISLEDLMGSNETFSAPPTELTVPLPNFTKDRISKENLEPTLQGFSRQEPAFSDPASVRRDKGAMRQAVQSATEIVRVGKKDQALFDRYYNYEDYYYDQINSAS